MHLIEKVADPRICPVVLNSRDTAVPYRKRPGSQNSLEW